jgi:hypothetical protein
MDGRLPGVDEEGHAVSATDWIAMAQAVALAIAAFFAWRAYRLAMDERRERRSDERLAERRRLLKDVVEELKGLAHQVEDLQWPAGTQRTDLIAAHQQRLKIALGFVPDASAQV